MHLEKEAEIYEIYSDGCSADGEQQRLQKVGGGLNHFPGCQASSLALTLKNIMLPRKEMPKPTHLNRMPCDGPL
jgi:hypothetical protein